MKVPQPSDQRVDAALRERLGEIDEDDDYEIDDFDAGFIDNVCGKGRGYPLTEKQRDHARKIIEKYDERAENKGDEEP